MDDTGRYALPDAGGQPNFKTFAPSALCTKQRNLSTEEGGWLKKS